MNMRLIINFCLCFCCVVYLSGCALGAAAVVATVATTSAAVVTKQDRTVLNNLHDKVLGFSVGDVISKYGKKAKSVDYLIYEDMVLLIGEVKSDSIKMEIEEKIWDLKGVKEVSNDIIVTSEEKVSRYYKVISGTTDYSLKAYVNGLLVANKNIHSLNYSVGVYKGTIYIVGVAHNKYERDLVTNLISGVKGVSKVVSYIRLVDSKLRKGERDRS